MRRVLKSVSAISLIVLSLIFASCKNKHSKVETSREALEETKEETTYVLESEEEIETETEMEVVEPVEAFSIKGFRESDKSTYIEVEFNKDIKDKFDAEPYIKIEPNATYTVSKHGNKITIRGDFNAKQTYKVTVEKGIKAFDGSQTVTSLEGDIKFEQKKPKIVFTSNGIILPSVNDKKVYIRTLNVTNINLIVRKVYSNNTTQFLQNFVFSGNGSFTGNFDDNGNNYNYDDYYYGDYYYDDYYYDEYYNGNYYNNRYNNFSNVGDTLYNVNLKIENDIDSWVQTAIDLSNVLDSNGMYMVEASFDEKGTSYNFDMSDGYMSGSDRRYLRENAKIMKTIISTDIGIMAQKNNKGYRVNVLNITSNKLLRGAKVYLISKNNQILEERTTNAEGIVDFSDNKKAFYVLVESGNSRSILPLTKLLNTNGFDVDGAYAASGIKGYIYTERGVYRPGDDVYVAIIARNNDEALLDNQPVKINVYDPTGVKIIDNDVVKDGKEGFYTYKFKTDVTSRTGIWKLETTIGDSIFKKDISVETVVPNKIRVNLDIPDVVDVNYMSDDWIISSEYLFGAPAANLSYGVSVDIKEEPINFSKYKDYIFKPNSSYSFYASRNANGTLDSEGKDIFNVNIDDINFGSVNMVADVVGRVTEDSGRNIISKKYIKIKKYDSYIGIENTSGYKAPGSPLDLKVICVSEDGENLVPNKKLKYKIYSNDHYWWWDYSDYDKFVRSFKSDKHTKLEEEGYITTEDVPVLLKNEVPMSEYIYVEIEDEETGQINVVNIQSSEWVDPSVTKKIETINVIADKKKYQVRDTAKIRFKGTKNAKALITIEKAGNIINQYLKDADEEEVIEDIMITKEMAPNVYVYVTLLQDYNTKENDRPLRMYGIVPLNVEDEDTKVELEIEAPENIRPNEKFLVKVKNKKNRQVDFTIAVVDEGLLDITNFETPAPWRYFFKKLAAGLSLFDNYSEIIDRPYGAINQILKVGGDESLLDEMARRKRLKDLGLEEADRFTPVSMFKGVMTTDNRGEAVVEFDMPNYMGAVRIMVVAAKGNSYGSAEKEMVVKAPLIVQPNLPRTLKTGDKINVPVTIFALEDGVRNIEVYYTFKGKTQTKKINLKKNDKEIVYFEDEIPKELGSEKVTIGVKSDIYNYEETVTMAINTNTAPISLSESQTLDAGAEVTFKPREDYVKGSVENVVTISNTPVLGLDKRLKFLIKYPYGCAEQTTSSVFPQLFIESLSTTHSYDKEEVVDNINAGIDRLKLFQLSDGSFSYWPGDKDTSDWATNYIGHFLTYAKKKGFYVPDSMYDSWVNYTTRKVKNTMISNNYDINTKCYSLYLLALSGNPNISEMNYMFENYFNDKNMNDTSKMYLAAAYSLAGEKDVAYKVSSKIDAKSVRNMYLVNSENSDYYRYNYGSDLCDIAVYLDCYNTVYGKFDQYAFEEIVNSLKSNNWYSTQTTAQCLIALSNIVRDSSQTTVRGVIEVDGILTEYSTTSQYRLNVEEGAKNIKVKADPNSIAYVNYYWEGIPLTNEVEDYSEGFSIEKFYYDNDGKNINVNGTKSGDSFWLEVVVKPTKKSMDNLYIDNIALTQILPTGWEIENLRVTDTSAPKWVQNKASGTVVSYTDIRDDRIMWFFNHRRNKEYRFFVKINSVTKGEYEFPGTILEAMYDNNYRAYRKGSKVTVK